MRYTYVWHDMHTLGEVAHESLFLGDMQEIFLDWCAVGVQNIFSSFFSWHFRDWNSRRPMFFMGHDKYIERSQQELYHLFLRCWENIHVNTTGKRELEVRTIKLYVSIDSMHSKRINLPIMFDAVWMRCSVTESGYNLKLRKSFLSSHPAASLRMIRTESTSDQKHIEISNDMFQFSTDQPYSSGSRYTYTWGDPYIRDLNFDLQWYLPEIISSCSAIFWMISWFFWSFLY